VAAVENNLKVGRNNRTPTDTEIRSSVESELWWSPYVDSDRVSVAVTDGVATLTGVVDSLRERRAATRNAVEGGAREVQNHIRVRFGPDDFRP
jgi:osmotically-inducible protein OsmY